MTNEIQVTDLSAWRSNATKPFTLPGGNVIRLKRVSLIDLIVAGQIPDTLSGLAAEVAVKGAGRAVSAEELKRYGEIVNVVVKAAAVEPRIGDAPGDDCLGLAEVEWVDKVAIFDWANGAASQLKPFRTAAKANAAKAA